MLINNYSYINKICGHTHSGITNPIKYINPMSMRSYYTYADVGPNNEQIKRDSFPTGTNPPYSLVMGDKGGLISSTTTTNGIGTLSTNLSMGINIEANLNGDGTLVSSLSLLAQLATSLVGSGSITNAALIGTVALAATLAGTGNITSGLNLLAFLNSSLQGSGGLAATLRGVASMQADIYVNQSEATVQQLIDGVWGTLASAYNDPNTMGEIMNNLGAATDPWATLLPGSYGPGTAGDIIGNPSVNVDPWTVPLAGSYNAGEAGYILGNLLSNIPDSVWNELKTSHNTTSSYGKIIQDLEILSKQIKALTAAQL